MTKQQQQVLDFIIQYHKDNGITPTSIAVANHIGKTGQRARQIIKELVELGKLEPTKRFGLYQLTVNN